MYDDADLVRWDLALSLAYPVGTHRTAEAIAEWNESDNIGRDSRFRVVGVERDGEAHLVRIAVSGKGFNGESFFRFTVADELISRLEIAP